MILPPELQSVLCALAPAFTQPTAARFAALLVAAVVTPGRRTVANRLRTAGPLGTGHLTAYQRVRSRAPWPGVRLGLALAALVRDRLPPDGAVTLVGDDTVDGHPGRTVYGKARHRDPVRSSRSYAAWRYGHRRVVLAVRVRFPFASRPWALPVLADLYRSEADNERLGRRHRTPARLMCRLLRVVLRRFPARRFVFAGDSGYGGHEAARFCRRHAGRLTPVSKPHPDANLYEPPPPYPGRGRPRAKGRPRPKPRAAAAAAPPARLTVSWYGGGTRSVGAVSGTGHWYKAGAGLVPLVWVFVRDETGTHRDEYFYSTDPGLSAAEVIGLYTGRRSVETTFEEMRSYLGLETTRGRCRDTVRRAAPCLFGLYSVVALAYHALPESGRAGRIAWAGKATVTFSDALTSARRRLWSECLLPRAGGEGILAEMPDRVRELLLTTLAPAA